MLIAAISAKVLNELLANGDGTPVELECRACKCCKFSMFLDPNTPKIVVTCAKCENPLLDIEVQLTP